MPLQMSSTAKLMEYHHGKSKSVVASLKPPSDHQRRRNSLPLAIREWFTSANDPGAKSPDARPPAAVAGKTAPDLRDVTRADLEASGRCSRRSLRLVTWYVRRA